MVKIFWLCYVLGSLVHGGFSPTASDIDFAIILNDPFKNKYNNKIDQMKKDIIECGLPLAERISIFWSTYESLKNNLSFGRFSSYDKTDLIQNGLILYGKDVRSNFPITTRQELEIDSAKFIIQYLNRNRIDQILMLSGLTKQIQIRQFTKLILFPIRLLYTLRTGLLAHNHVAYPYYLIHEKNMKSKLVDFAYNLRSATSDKQDSFLKKNQDLILSSSKITLLMYKEIIHEYRLKMIIYNEKILAEELLFCFNQISSLKPFSYT